MKTPPFVHLHLHTGYSINDGLLRIPELMEETARRGTPAVALTDLNNLFAAIKFYGAAMERGIKPVIGCELHIRADNTNEAADEIVLLCGDERGYHNLTRLVSRAYVEGQEHDTPHILRDWLEDCNEGLIALSGGPRGDIGKALASGESKRLDRALSFWTGLFADRYYIELHNTGREGEKAYLERALALASKSALPVVATNDVRFLRREDFESHEAKVCISQGHILADKRRPRRYSPEQYLKSAEEMAALFKDVPGALQNTVEIATRCTLELEFGKTLLPDFPLPEGETAADKITAGARKGLEERLAGTDSSGHEQYHRRLASELEIIGDMGYQSYFLIVADFIAWAKREGIPVGPGRGSGAGSLVAWALGITELDPIHYDLLFERFLNPERVSMPDFDVDFCIEGRDRVIQYVVDRYGRDRVSQIITFGSLGAKAAVRDVGRVLGHSYGFVDRVAKLIPNQINITLNEALTQSQELTEWCRNDNDVRQILDDARKLEGLARNPGKHAGGVVISPTPMEDYTALYCEPGSRNAVTQFDMKDIEKIGLVKFDFLGLKTLTVIARAVAHLRARGAADIDIGRIPLDDTKVYDLLREGNTAAIFQLESEGIRRLMKNLRPDHFDDIVALVALYRPGPLQSGMSDEYAERKHDVARIRFPHPKVKSILEPTYGVILYQEQVMEIARVLAGYTLGAADILRRAMGKKITKEMAEQRTVFVEGAVARGVEKRTATHIFDQMEKFADYGFNKSHSVAYALLAYQTAWLKANYPGAFMAAVMSADMDDTDKIVYLIGECRLMGLEVEPSDINRSEYGFAEVDGGGILYGMGAIRNAGAAAIETIVEDRRVGGAYSSLRDFCARLVPAISKNLLETLIRAGTFDSVEHDRGAMLHHLPRIYALAEQRANNRNTGQSDLFGEPPKESDCPPLDTAERISREQLLKMERDSLGLYLTDHPVSWYRQELTSMTDMSLHEVKRLAGDASVQNMGEHKTLWLSGVIMNMRVRYTRQGKAAFFTLDDGSGRLELALFDKDYANYADMLSHDDIVVVEVYRNAYDNTRETSRWRTRTILTLDQARKRFSKNVQISIRADADEDERLPGRLEESLSPFIEPGGCPVIVSLRTAEAATRLRLGDDWKVRPCEEMLCRLQRIDGVEQVAFNY